MGEIDDHTILEQCRRKELQRAGFDLLMEKYQQQVYWQVRKMVIDHDDADDLVQDIFIKVWKNLHAFREDSKLSTWIYRIAANEVLSFLKKKKRMSFLSFGLYEEKLAGKLRAADYFTGDHIEAKFQRAMLTLPPKQRLVFQMKYYDEKTYEAMSEMLGTSVGALKASYHHAVKKIERYFTGH